MSVPRLPSLARDVSCCGPSGREWLDLPVVPTRLACLHAPATSDPGCAWVVQDICNLHSDSAFSGPGNHIHLLEQREAMFIHSLRKGVWLRGPICTLEARTCRSSSEKEPQPLGSVSYVPVLETRPQPLETQRLHLSNAAVHWTPRQAASQWILEILLSQELPVPSTGDSLMRSHLPGWGRSSREPRYL